MRAPTGRPRPPRRRPRRGRAPSAPPPPPPATRRRSEDADHVAPDDAGGNHLYLGSTGPSWQYSTAPLTDASGAPVAGPRPGAAGYALRLGPSDVLMVPEFRGFPSKAITVEFW